MANLFRDAQQKRLFFLIHAALLLVAALVAGRAFLANQPLFPAFKTRLPLGVVWNYTFIFLLWNLFLAALPFWFAFAAEKLQRDKRSPVWVGGLLLCWLAFFPNAPYIVTDLIHLKHRPPVPFWYDLATLFSGALTGLMLGLFSLYEADRALQQAAIYQRRRRLFTLCIGLLCGFGIWLGRYQRFNSWDIVTRPFELLGNIIESLATRAVFMQAMGVTLLFSALVLTGYALLSAMLQRD